MRKRSDMSISVNWLRSHHGISGISMFRSRMQDGDSYSGKGSWLELISNFPFLCESETHARRGVACQGETLSVSEIPSSLTGCS